MMDEGRQADIKELEKAKATAPDQDTLTNIAKAEKMIRSEQQCSYAKGMRKALVKEARKGNKGGIRSVQETINKSTNKSGEMEKKSFAVNWPEGLYERIYGV